jgi:hypothetical protein
MTAPWTSPADAHKVVRDMVQRGAGGVWRAVSPPRPTKVQRAVLALLMQGDELAVDTDGIIRLTPSATTVPLRVARALIEHGWVEEPLPELPLFGEPARPGAITETGRNAFVRGTRA